MSTLLIQNGRIITATDDCEADLLVDGETVARIGRNLSVGADRVLDAAGRLVLPGGVDVHTHLDLPAAGTVSSDDFETGTIAAAFGGTTTIVDFATQNRGETMRHALDQWFARAEGRAVIDYGFHMIVTELPESALPDLDALVREGIPSFKLFMAYPDRLMVDDATILRALRRTGDNGGLIAVHAENGGVIDALVKKALAEGRTAPKYHALTRPSSAEGEATARAIALAEMAGVPIYIVHLTAAESLAAVREAHGRGTPVWAETCPQYLFLSDELYQAPGFEAAKYVMSPPLRPREHQAELWKGLKSHDLHVIATDHCPFCMKEGYQGLPKQKELGLDDFSKIPNGAPGIETRMSLIHDGGVAAGRISLNRLVDLCCTAPARIMGLHPRKGTLAVGSDADIVIFDPGKEVTLSWKTLHMRVDYNPYEGRRVRGAPEVVIARGRVIVEGGKFLGRPGDGRFLKRGHPDF